MSEAVIHVEVRLYGAGGRPAERRVALPGGSRIRDLLGRLGIPEAEVGVVLVNREDAAFDRPLQEGDRVTLIPPIGGG